MKFNFRPFVPTDEDIERSRSPEALAALQKRVGDLFSSWRALYQAPFRGITTDGKIVRNLYSLQPNNAPTHAMVKAAKELLANLSDEQRAAMMFPIDSHQWRSWNNTPLWVYEFGLLMETLPGSQREAILEVVRAGLSARGFQMTRDVMRLNQFLGELIQNTAMLGEWSYRFSVFGSPSTTEPWGWQLYGHHLALNCFVIGEQMVLSPTFMGAEPPGADEGPFAGIHLFEDQEEAGLRVVRALSRQQQDQAIIYPSILSKDLPPERKHTDDGRHWGGAFQDNRVIPYEGISVADFASKQRKLVLDLVEIHVSTLPAGPRKARINEVERYLGETHFAWIGGFGDESAFYYKLHSPVVMIEFDHHPGILLTNKEPSRAHAHSIVRTPNGNDYGADLLRLHYQHAHKGHRPGQ
jgi:Protein of unknown function (DUF3500)